MSIGRKMTLAFIIVVAALAFVGVVSYLGTNRLVETSRRVERSHDVLEQIDAMMLALRDAETGQRGFLLTGKEEYLAPYVGALGTIEGLLKELRTLTADDPGVRQKLLRVEEPVGRKLAELKETIELRRQKGPEAALAVVMTDRGKGDMDEIRRVIDEVRAEENRALDEREREAQATAVSTSRVILIGTLVALTLTFVTGLAITRGLTRPLRTLVDAAGQIGAGTLDHPIDIHSRDEIGVMAEAFRKMVSNLRSTMVDVKTEKKSRERAEKLLDAVKEAVARLSSTTNEILASTTQQAAGAQEQAAAISQTVATVDEITQTATHAAQRAKGLGEAVQRNLEVGQAGRAAVDSSIAAMNRLKEQVESTAGNILMLAEQAQAIGEIIATVNDIADQTNILALNAAIEASRAGEQGRGFAVVAGEVKALADQSKRATQQVRQILGEIQKATNTAVLSTEEVTKGVAAAIKTGGQSSQTINSLADTLADASQAAAQIVASAGQQATGMAQINQAMKNLDQVARQNLVATRQVEQAAQDLSTLGNKLTGLTTE